MIEYRIINSSDLKEVDEYHRMRYILWPHHEEQELKEEMLKILNGTTFYKNELSWTTFVAIRESGELGGFIEITLFPELDFSDSRPIGFIEGWYVDEDLRKTGVGRELVNTAASWISKQGCSEIASDVEEHNIVSQIAHKHLGFKKVKLEDGCIFYKKSVV